MTDVLIRDQTPADAGAVSALLTAVFGRPVVAELSERLAALQGPGARLVAAQDGVVIGQVQVSRGWVDAPDELIEVLVLSPLGVVPAEQGRGVGSRLVRAAIERAEQLGAPALFLEGSPRFYPRFGFLPGGECGFTKPSVRIPDKAFQVILRPDAPAGLTGALVYPEVFWQLDCVGRRNRPGSS